MLYTIHFVEMMLMLASRNILHPVAAFTASAKSCKIIVALLYNMSKLNERALSRYVKVGYYKGPCQLSAVDIITKQGYHPKIC